jgi:hypothetical protein
MDYGQIIAHIQAMGILYIRLPGVLKRSPARHAWQLGEHNPGSMSTRTIHLSPGNGLMPADRSEA